MCSAAYSTKMNEDAAMILRVLVDPMVPRLYVLAVQEFQHPFFELPRPFTGNDLHRLHTLLLGLVHDALECFVYFVTPLCDRVKVEM